MNRIKDKEEEIQKQLEELESILPSSYKEYERSIEKKAACERYFEKVVESLIELGYLILKKERFSIPEDNRIFYALFEKNVISESLMHRLSNAKGMRNILSHKYGEVNDELVYESITEELIRDSEDFLNSIEEYFSK